MKWRPPMLVERTGPEPYYSPEFAAKRWDASNSVTVLKRHATCSSAGQRSSPARRRRPSLIQLGTFPESIVKSVTRTAGTECTTFLPTAPSLSLQANRGCSNHLRFGESVPSSIQTICIDPSDGALKGQTRNIPVRDWSKDAALRMLLGAENVSFPMLHKT